MHLFLRSEFLTAVTAKNTFLWDVTPCSLEKFTDNFRNLVLGFGVEDLSSVLCHEDGGSRFLRNVAKFLPSISAAH